MTWEEAWDITQRTLGYTNHALLPEALEKWPVDLLETIIPRQLEIVYEINRRFLDGVRRRYPGDAARVQRVSLIEEAPTRRVRMAHLAPPDDAAYLFLRGKSGPRLHAIEADPQIRRRFDAFSLPRWTECEDFRDIICAFGKLYPLRKPSKLGERGIIQKVPDASEGITGPVTRVLALAAIEERRLVTAYDATDLAGMDRWLHRTVMSNLAGRGNPGPI